MKLQFKHQKFQEDAARAVCDVFTGQPLASRSYVVDPGKSADGQGTLINIRGFDNALEITRAPRRAGQISERAGRNG